MSYDIDLSTRCSICDEPLDDLGDICGECADAIAAVQRAAREACEEAARWDDDE